jgi:homoserine O-acetyltransferase
VLPALRALSRRPPVLALEALAVLGAGCRSEQRFADIGDLPLASGAVVRDCRIGYRTFGTLNAGRTNAVLLLPWFMGRSVELARHVGPGRLVDSSRYYVVAVDGLGAGVSTSPSNSGAQPGAAFPSYSVRDMVEAERRLVLQLRIDRLRAVVGTSLGGMQVFEWLTAFPDAAERGVAIAGSPRLPEAERARWREDARATATRPRWKRAAEAAARAAPLAAWRALGQDPIDYARQAECVASADVTSGRGESLADSAARVRARVLVVVSPTDEMVDPGPAIEFARLAGATLLRLEGRGGHDAPAREKGRLWPAVDRFLAE